MSTLLRRVPPLMAGDHLSVAEFERRVFPGLWLNAAALIREDLPAALETLQQGLAQHEHASFVAHLAQAGRKRRKK